MFDTIKCILLGITGGLRDTKEARKLVWLLAITFAAGLLATTFAAWVSYPAYRGMVQFLTGADIIAVSFTAGVALFIYFELAYLSGFSVEVWRGVPMTERNYNRLGAIIFGICAVIFLSVDFYMNMQGKVYRAQEAAGTVATFTYQTPPDQVQRMEADRRKVDQLTSGKIGGLGWRDEKTGVWNLNKSGKRALEALELSIRRTEQADSVARAAFIADQVRTNADRDSRQATIGATLENAVYGVYLFVLLLTIVQAYIVEVIQAATQGKQIAPASQQQAQQRNQPGAMGYAIGKTRQDFEALERRLQELEKREGSDPENRAAIGYQRPEPNPNPERKNRNVSPGIVPEHTYQRELFFDNQNPEFTTRHQPDKVRGIDPALYSRFLKIAQAVLSETGKHNKAEIARRMQISEKTASKYFKVAIKQKQLKP